MNKKKQIGDVKRTFSDTTKLRSFINYQNKVNIEKELKKFVTWYKNIFIENQNEM